MAYVKRVMIILSLILFSGYNNLIRGMSSVSIYLESFKTFSYYKDTVSTSQFDEIVLTKMDSISKEWEGIGKYQCPPEIVYRGKFQELPCITYYDIYGCNRAFGTWVPLTDAFYNSCNNKIYFPSDNIDDFNAVFGARLDNNRNKAFMIRFILLYLNISNIDSGFIILGDRFDIEQQFKNAGKPRGVIAADLDIISLIEENNPEYMQPVQFDEKGDHFVINFNTLSGYKIEHWVFNIYTDSIALKSRERKGTFISDIYDDQDIFEKIGVSKDSARMRFERYWDSLETKDSNRLDK